jgi:hypothetical protein
MREMFEDPGVNGRILLEWFLGEVRWEVLDRTRLAQIWDQWLALSKTVMNLWVP